MTGETTALVESTLGGNFQALRVMLQEAVDGGMSSGADDGADATGIGRWPAATGMDKASLQSIETFITDQFLPTLRAGISEGLPSLDFSVSSKINAE